MIDLVMFDRVILGNAIAKISKALMTIPSLVDWQIGGFLVLGYGVLALILGYATGLIRFQLVESWPLATRILSTSLFAPALLEEMIFRVSLLPLPTGNLEQLPWLSAIASIVLFVIYHPLNALTFFPQGRSLFWRPIFLVLAGFLGIVCLLGYWLSRSLWLPVTIHWLVVSCWLILGDGHSLLYQEATKD